MGNGWGTTHPEHNTLFLGGNDADAYSMAEPSLILSVVGFEYISRYAVFYGFNSEECKKKTT